MRLAGRVVGSTAVSWLAAALAASAAPVGAAGPPREGSAEPGARPPAQQTLQPGQAAQFESLAEVFRIQVALRGPDGKPARGLGIEDIELLVDGAPRRILDLREIDAATLRASEFVAADADGRDGGSGGAADPNGDVLAAADATRPADAHRSAAARLPSTVLRPTVGAALPTAARRRFLLFFDLAFINRRGLGYARGAAKTFLDDIAREGDMVGLATYSPNRGLLYQIPFTSDRTQIRAAVEGLGVGRSTESVDNARIDLEALSRAMAGFGLDSDDTSALASAQDLERTARQFEASRVALALEDMAEAMGPLQGRKQILYFSAGMPDGMIWSRDGDGGAFRDMATAVEAARRADVVINSFMPAVMPVAGMHDVTNMQSTFTSGSQISVLGDRGFLSYVAGETGGTASFFRHQLKGGLEDVEENTRAYYVLAFPVLENDPATISIQVRPRQPEVTVAWAPTRLTLPRGQEVSVAARQLQIADALEIGNDVRTMAVDVLAVRVGRQDGYGRVAVAAEIPARQLQQLIEERDEDRLDLEILGVVLRSTGQLADHFRTRIKLEDVAGRLQRIDAPLRYENVLAVPPGTYFVKVLFREANLSRFASRSLRLEIPETDPPDFAVDTPLLVLPAVPGSFVRGVDPDHPPSHRAGLPLADPFVIGAQPLLPQIRPVATAAQDVDLLVHVRHPTHHPFTGSPDVAAQCWLENDAGDRFVLSGLRLLTSTHDAEADSTRMLLRLSLSPSLPSGRYSLIVQVSDRIAGRSAAAWTELSVASAFEPVR